MSFFIVLYKILLHIYAVLVQVLYLYILLIEYVIDMSHLPTPLGLPNRITK